MLLLGWVVVACGRPASEQGGDAGPAVEPEPGGFAAMCPSGRMRALLWQPGGTEVPRAGSALAEDRARAIALARSVGLEIEFVPVLQRADLIPALLAGRGDLVATPLVSRSSISGVAFSQPIRQVDRVVVVSSRLRRPPGGPAELRRLALLHTTAGDDALLDRLEREAGDRLEVVATADPADSDEILARVAADPRLAAVVLGHRLEDYLAFRDDVQAAFTVDRLPLALAVRREAADVWNTGNILLTEFALTPHLRRRHGGDLEQMTERGVLRVAMLNNALAYFIYRGQQVGFQYELAERLARKLGLRLEVVVPDRPAELSRLLVEQRADLALVTPTLEDPHFEDCAYSLPLDHADQVLVQPAGEEPIRRRAELTGRTVHVRRSSQYFRTLRRLRAQVPTLRIATVDEKLGTEDLIRRVGEGEIPLTVANSAMLAVEQTYRDDIQGTLVLSRARPLVFAVRTESRALLKRLNRFVLETCGGPAYQALLDRYFGRNQRLGAVREASLSVGGAISPYDDLAKRIGREHGVDWRLILAQAHQESRFHPRAVSWAGAQGLMQIMPGTAREMGLADPWDPEQNMRTGVAYLSHLIDRIDPSLPMRQRIRFALVAYNAGLGHLRDARRLARGKGWDPDRWFGHVERAMALLEKPRYYRRARHGYVRGSEPVQYVSRIQDKYDAYTRLAEPGG